MTDKITCELCEGDELCPHPICYAQETQSKPLAEDWHEELEINEEQLALNYDTE